MANTLLGAPSVADVQLFMDTLATHLKATYSTLGLNAPSTESGTFAIKANTAYNTLLGDGASLYGLSNPAWKSLIKDPMAAFKKAFRWDVLYARLMGGIAGTIGTLDSQVSANLPSGWTFTSSTILHPFDAWLMRANAANSGVPATPAAAGTVAAANTSGGGLATVLVGSAPRIKHTLVGASSWLESLPSAAGTQTAIASPNNSYTYTIAGTVPSGVTAVRVYRQLMGGSGNYYWDQDVAATAGASYPSITLTQPDILLRQDWQPPSWFQIAMVPEAAALFALAYATQGTNNIDNQPLVYSTGSMLSESNVAVGNSNAFLGLGNVAQHAEFGNSVLTGAATQTYTAGSLLTANNTARNAQGFAGSIGVQARVTTALAAAGTVTISYTYYDATNGWGSVQTQTGISATFGAATLGSLATFTITAGRIVRSVTVTAVSGFSSATGAFCVEGVPCRAY